MDFVADNKANVQKRTHMNGFLDIFQKSLLDKQVFVLFLLCLLQTPCKFDRY